MSQATIVTSTGLYFDILEPTPEMVCIEDIAHSSSQCNRFTGHCRFPYPVSQHSRLGSFLVPMKYALRFLLHDASLDECYADRVNHRQDWYEQIKAFNTPDAARLAREIYADNDIYVGMRSEVELNAVRDERLFDYSIWVDRSKHVSPEPSTSCSVTKEMANYVIDNNGTLEQLKIKTLSLYWDLVSLEYAGKLNSEN